MPPRWRDQPEAVAGRRRRSDAPTGCRHARTGCAHGPQQEEKKPGSFGRKVQPLARAQIAALGHDAGDSCGSRGAQRFLHRPQGLSFVLGLDQEEAGRIEAQTAEPMTIGASEKPAGKDEHHGRRFRQTPEQGRGEAECCRPVLPLGRADLVEGAEAEAPLREAVVERGHAEGEDARCRQPLHLRQEAPQLMQHLLALTQKT